MPDAALQQLLERPGSLPRVRYGGARGTRHGVVQAVERHTGVVAVDLEHVAVAMNPHTKPIVETVRPRASTWDEHLGDQRGRHNPAAEKCAPQSADVCDRRVDAAVTAAEHGKVKDVGAQSLNVQVAQCRGPRELVGAQERGRLDPRRVADPLADERVEDRPAVRSAMSARTTYPPLL